MIFEVVGGDFKNVGVVSSYIKRFMREAGYDKESVRRTVIAIFEAEVNIVSYARHGHIDVNFNNNTVEILVNDVGPGIENIELAMREGFSTASDEIRRLGFGAGMGLPNMKRNVDIFEISSTVGVGTTIKMVNFLQKKNSVL